MTETKPGKSSVSASLQRLRGQRFCPPGKDVNDIYVEEGLDALRGGSGMSEGEVFEQIDYARPMKEVVLMIEGKGLKVTGLDLMTGTLIVKVPEPIRMPQRSLWEE